MTGLALLALAVLAVGCAVASRTARLRNRTGQDPRPLARYGSHSVDDRDRARVAADLALLRGRSGPPAS
ncbi:hypothetical protein [Rhodococcus triatomae]|nr:hypothetical protein G419_07439 [Rhodococcus triatomae BKS 15-14]